MLNGRPILKVMQQGVGFTCAHCVKLWWSVDRGLSECKSSHEGGECAGPLAGQAFPHYEGPLAGNLDRFCFVCGSEPSCVAVVPQGRVGVCKVHIEWLGTYTRPCEKPPFVTHQYIDTIGGK